MTREIPSHSLAAWPRQPTSPWCGPAFTCSVICSSSARRD